MVTQIAGANAVRVDGANFDARACECGHIEDKEYVRASHWTGSLEAFTPKLICLSPKMPVVTPKVTDKPHEMDILAGAPATSTVAV